MSAPSEELESGSSTFASGQVHEEVTLMQSNDVNLNPEDTDISDLKLVTLDTVVEVHNEPSEQEIEEEDKVEVVQEPEIKLESEFCEESAKPETESEVNKDNVEIEPEVSEDIPIERDVEPAAEVEQVESDDEVSKEDDEDEGVDMDSLKPSRPEEAPEKEQEPECDNSSEGEEEQDCEPQAQDEGMCMMSTPELQKIRQEQVRKWLIFEQENPMHGPESSLQVSMEADSLAAGSQQKLVDIDSLYDQESEECDPDGLGNRRVRFLTDQEGNLLISVFMSNSVPSTPSEETSITLAGAAEEGEKNETSDAVEDDTQQVSPSLVVSPPSLDVIPQEDELVDSIEPSAPKMEDLDEPREANDLVMLLDEECLQKMPPQEKPPAPPVSGDDSANESSDETLSVSSCNSMIEINRSGSYDVTVQDEPESLTEEQSRNDDDRTESRDDTYQSEQLLDDIKIPMESTTSTPGVACFQLGVLEQSPVTLERREDDFLEMQNDEEEHSSLIIHEFESHDEGEATHNPTPLSDMIMKTPNIDENNNVVDDTIVEEDEEEEEQVTRNEAPVLLQFNPEIGEKINMPELKRSTSSSDGEGEEEHMERAATASSCHSQQNSESSGENQNHLMPSEMEQEGQMVSLCIQEEHISSVALSIAKWESLAKSQSNENLSTVVPSSSSSSGHAPITKSVSTPCPKTGSGGNVTPTAFAHRPLPMKPVQPVAPIQGKETPQNTRVVIHGSNTPSNNEPLMITKAAGWACWGNGKKESGGVVAPQQSSQENMTGDEAIYAQPNQQAGSLMTNIANPSAILKSYPKPLSKGEILTWFKEGEVHRAGLLLNYAQSHHHAPIPGHHGTNHMSPVLVSWFFGLISRQQAERYLHGQPPGTFLVRISTRIWGYTLSYQASNGRIKHFLISAINPAVPATLETAPSETALPPQSCKQQRMSPFLPQGRYAFIGTNMTPYGTLVSLIRHHSHAPITKLGGEKLLNPCRGGPQIAGLESVFQKSLVTAAPPVPQNTYMVA